MDPLNARPDLLPDLLIEFRRYLHAAFLGDVHHVRVIPHCGIVQPVQLFSQGSMRAAYPARPDCYEFNIASKLASSVSFPSITEGGTGRPSSIISAHGATRGVKEHLAPVWQGHCGAGVGTHVKRSLVHHPQARQQLGGNIGHGPSSMTTINPTRLMISPPDDIKVGTKRAMQPCPIIRGLIYL